MMMLLTLRRLVNQLLCWLGMHQWGEWKTIVHSEGAYDQEQWDERRCRRNGCKRCQEIYVIE